jgi:hypothetical protein
MAYNTSSPPNSMFRKLLSKFAITCVNIRTEPSLSCDISAASSSDPLYTSTICFNSTEYFNTHVWRKDACAISMHAKCEMTNQWLSSPRLTLLLSLLTGQFSRLRKAIGNINAVPTWTCSFTLRGPLSAGKRQTYWDFALTYFSKDELTEVKCEDSCIQGLDFFEPWGIRRRTLSTCR